MLRGILMNFLTPNVILAYYPTFAGGKFVINCMSLSKYSVISDPRYAVQDMSYTTFDSSYYQFKLNSVMTTLPSPDKKTQWRDFEFREWQFAGIGNNEYGQQSVDYLRNYKFTSMLEQVVESGRYHFFVSHYYDVTKGFKQVWPNAKIISLVNWKNFVNLAGVFKMSPGEDLDKHLDYLLDFPSTLPWPSLIYDVDHNIFSKENHLRSIQNLYIALGWDDFNEDLVGKYYDEYRYLHNF